MVNIKVMNGNDCMHLVHGLGKAVRKYQASDSSEKDLADHLTGNMQSCLQCAQSTQEKMCLSDGKSLYVPLSDLCTDVLSIYGHEAHHS